MVCRLHIDQRAITPNFAPLPQSWPEKNFGPKKNFGQKKKIWSEKKILVRINICQKKKNGLKKNFGP